MTKRTKQLQGGPVHPDHDPNWQPTIERDRQPRINANCVNALLRSEWDNTHDEGRVMAIAGQIVEGLSHNQLMMIATGSAVLVGVSPGPLELRKNT